MEKDAKYISFYRTADYKTMRRLIAAGLVYQTLEWNYAGTQATAVFEDRQRCQVVLDKHRRGELLLNSRDVDRADEELKTELHP